jgi:hypothetical protein
MLGAVVSTGFVSGAVKLWGFGVGGVGEAEPGVVPGYSILPEGLSLGLMLSLGSGAEGSMLGGVVSPGVENSGEVLGVV